MNQRKGLFAAIGMLTASAFQAHAQAPTAPPAPAPAPKPAPNAGSNGVTVTGTRPGVTTSIDSRTYLIDRDLNAANGSVGDALRNVPSVQVDLQGNLSLRGDANVTILVDGKPSPLFEVPSRADSLLNFPARDIERVEVMTTPSAAFSPEGSGGVINLITKQSRSAADIKATSGSVQVQYGDSGDKRFGGNLTHRAGKLTITASAFAQRGFIRTLGGDAVRAARANPSALPFVTMTKNFQDAPRLTNEFANLNFRYDATPKTALTAGVSVTGVDQDRGLGFQSLGFIGGVPVSDLVSLTEGPSRTSNYRLTAGLTHKFGEEGHEFSANANIWRVGQYTRGDSVVQQVFPAAPISFEQTLSRNTVHQGQFTLNYKRPLADGAKVNVGYELATNDNEYERVLARGASVGARAIVPGLTNTLGFDQSIHAGFVTYERPFGDLSAQLGLRVEALDRELDQITSGTTVDRDDVSYYPTLNFRYKIDDEQSLHGGYSRRVQRPAPPQLNPFREQISRLAFNEGNPNLEPMETDSFELGYQQRKGQNFYLATAYWREYRNDFTAVVTDLGGGTSLSRQENLGSSRRGGVELVANGRVAGVLRYGLSTNMFYGEIDADNLGFVGKRSAVGISGNTNLSWDATANDLMQLNVNANGKALAAQGYTLPYAMLNFGWRHKFNDRLAATLTVNNVLDNVRVKFVVDTPILSSTVHTKLPRTASFQLSYAFGGAKQQDTPIDFGGGGPN